MIQPAATRTSFQPRLEALRGLAALAVAGGHAILLFAVSKQELQGIRLLCMLLNGHAAVAIFFALSGYVLGLGLRRREQALWSAAAIFNAKRMLRIYPAMLLSLVMIVVALSVHIPPASRPAASAVWHPNFYASYDIAVTTAVFIENITFRNFSLNPVMWTLRIELLCSACLPFVHAFCRRASRRAQVLLFAALTLLPITHFSKASFLPLFIFYLGYQISVVDATGWSALLARFRGRWWVIWSIMLTAVPLAEFTQAPKLIQGFCVLAEGLCAAAVVARVVHGGDGRWLRVLDFGFSKLLGKLSYSFYLIHFPVLFFVLEPVWRLLPGPLAMGLPTLAGLITWGVSSAIALPISWLLYRSVEVPFIALGRKLDPPNVKPQ